MEGHIGENLQVVMNESVKKCGMLDWVAVADNTVSVNLAVECLVSFTWAVAHMPYIYTDISFQAMRINNSQTL